MTPLAIDYPPVEFIIFAVAILLGVIGKIIEFAREIRKKSIETEERADEQFGADLGEAPEPPAVEVPARLELVRRPLPRRELPASDVAAPVALRPPPPPPIVSLKPRAEHPVRRLLRDPRGARNAILLAEILGPPKALRRGR